ncbi:MAG: hypothetical protein OXP69_11110 [Spirochaetaceae bacterium]|nr:hypothetical protein [Spirochaetaceae bacterium]
MGGARPARVPRLVDDAAWGENIAADEFMLQPGGIDAITEFPVSNTDWKGNPMYWADPLWFDR